MPVTTTSRRTTADPGRADPPSGVPATSTSAGAAAVAGARDARTTPGARSPWQAPPDPELDPPVGGGPTTRGSGAGGSRGDDLRTLVGTRIHVRVDAIDDADDDSGDEDDSWDDGHDLDEDDGLGGTAGRGCPDCGRSMAARIACLRGRTAGRVAGPAQDRGAVTAEYAVLIVAVVGFAGLLTAILAGDEVRQILTGLVQRALSV